MRQAARSSADADSRAEVGATASGAPAAATTLRRRTSTASRAPIRTPPRAPTSAGMPAKASAQAPASQPRNAQIATMANGFMACTVPGPRPRVDPLFVPGRRDLLVAAPMRTGGRGSCFDPGRDHYMASAAIPASSSTSPLAAHWSLLDHRRKSLVDLVKTATARPSGRLGCSGLAPCTAHPGLRGATGQGTKLMVSSHATRSARRFFAPTTNWPRPSGNLLPVRPQQPLGCLSSLNQNRRASVVILHRSFGTACETDCSRASRKRFCKVPGPEYWQRHSHQP